MSKYHSRKITVDGVSYDSKKEYNRYRELSMLEDAGIIHDLKRQVKFELLPSQRDLIIGGSYRAPCCTFDFIFEGDRLIVEDVKGIRTKDYILKRKMLLYFHGIRIKEV
ncbi:MAG: DUF1064 domain-containing protein [Lachnospiraceae bacterium]